MTENNSFKKLIRLRMRITGESHTTALRHLRKAPSPKNIPDLTKIIRPEELRIIQANLQEPGLTVVSGRMNSGKTTLLDSILVHGCDKQQLRTILVEDFQEFATSSEENNLLHLVSKADFTEEVLLAQIARMRPELVGLHEIRQSHPNAVNLMLAGVHLATTLHSHSAEQSLGRLVGLYDSYTILSHVKTLVQIESIQSSKGLIPVISVSSFDAEAREAYMDNNLESHYRELGVISVEEKLKELVDDGTITFDKGYYYHNS